MLSTINNKISFYEHKPGVSFHCSPAIKEIIAYQNVSVNFVPPFSTEFNTKENVSFHIPVDNYSSSQEVSIDEGSMFNLIKT
jgi:hypothetical protein